MFKTSASEPNRLTAIKNYVLDGGALLMVGGYLTMSGLDGRARYGRSLLADLLPVELLDGNDLVETPEDVAPRPLPSHPAVPDVADWPHLLGYNRTRARVPGEVLIEVDRDPLITVGEVGAGRVEVFTSDLAAHWAPQASCSGTAVRRSGSR